MIRLLIISSFLLLIYPLLLKECDRILPPRENPGERIYFNSFETPRDTSGWLGSIWLSNDAPPSGGSHSASVTGGCIHPHAWYYLPPIKQESFLMIRFWGKNLSNGGSVEMELSSGGEQIAVGVSDPAWRSYTSSDTLFCPSGSRVRLSMSAGGIIPSSMLVDLIEVVRVR